MVEIRIGLSLPHSASLSETGMDCSLPWSQGSECLPGSATSTSVHSEGGLTQTKSDKTAESESDLIEQLAFLSGPLMSYRDGLYYMETAPQC